MSALRLRLSKVTSLALPSEPDPKVVGLVDKELGEKSGGVIHAVVSYLKNMLIATVFTLTYILGLDPISLRLYLNPNSHLYSQWEARQLFESWCKEYNKTYPSEDEKLYRFGVFKETLEWCARNNLRTLSRCSGTNCFADQTEDELIHSLFLDGSYISDSD
ncbi:papain-like [Lotus japonicus]|uniref:papain-like n=1 Tax=Lotus japonicus TaxID=34305 RepID=UPI002585CBAE|nr:papain-like [Lotus japonicus]